MPSDDARYELSNEEIDRYCSRFGADYGGCTPKDRLPPVSNKFIVVNLDNHTGPGTHWVLLYNCNPHEVIYFDSYGEPPPTPVAKWMNRTGKKTQLTSQQEIQALGSPWCGYLVLACIDALQSGLTFTQFIDTFSLNPSINDKNIRKWAIKVFTQLKRKTD